MKLIIINGGNILLILTLGCHVSHQSVFSTKNLKRAQRVLRSDRYKCEFDDANTKLALAFMTLSECSYSLLTVHKFLTAADELLDICENHADSLQQIRLCEWVETRLAEQQTLSEKGDHRRLCKKHRAVYKTKSEKICKIFGTNVSPFFRSSKNDWVPSSTKRLPLSIYQ